MRVAAGIFAAARRILRSAMVTSALFDAFAADFNGTGRVARSRAGVASQ
jgi:hypothetical protein